MLHLQSPCRLDAVGEFRSIVREEWVPDTHVHRLAEYRGRKVFLVFWASW